MNLRQGSRYLLTYPFSGRNVLSILVPPFSVFLSFPSALVTSLFLGSHASCPLYADFLTGTGGYGIDKPSSAHVTGR